MRMQLYSTDCSGLVGRDRGASKAYQPPQVLQTGNTCGFRPSWRGRRGRRAVVTTKMRLIHAASPRAQGFFERFTVTDRQSILSNLRRDHDRKDGKVALESWTHRQHWWDRFASSG